MRAFAFFGGIVICSVAIATASPPQATNSIGQQAPQLEQNQSAPPNTEPASAQPQSPQTTQAGPSQTTKAGSSKVTLNGGQITDILNYIATLTRSAELKLELLKFDPVKPKQPEDFFGNPYSAQPGKSLGFTLGDGTWKSVNTTISNAVAVPNIAAVNFVPEVGLRARLPYGTFGAYLPGQYVMLMSFKYQNLQLYFEGRLVGSCSIQDNGNLKKLQDLLLNPSAQPRWFVNSALPTESR